MKVKKTKSNIRKKVLLDILDLLYNNLSESEYYFSEIECYEGKKYLNEYEKILGDIEDMYFEQLDKNVNLKKDNEFELEYKSAECISNTGLEDSFEVGISYILRNEDSDELITVEDMNGHDKTVLRERFGEITSSYRKEVEYET